MKKSVFVIICLVLEASYLCFSQTTDYGLPDKAEDGVMFHAERWLFTDITSNLETFASSGYNAIQVSPVTPVKTGTESEWWGLYQPCKLEIGNYLGTYSEFVELCTTAGEYGIKIIVDAVLNHLADEDGTCGSISPEVDSNILAHSSTWLRFIGCCGSDASAYQDRYKLTQYALGALPEWNTQNSEVQALHAQFLNNCIAAGADGFRFDAAKHIETNIYEDEGQSWAGDYWDNVLGALDNSSSLYLFGEVLPNYADNDEAYRQYFDITAHAYGYTLRSAVEDQYVGNLLSINHFNGTIPQEKALCYVENHDDYHDGSSTSMSDESRKLAYALLIPRAGLTPRFYGRPYDELYKDADIVAVNQFRNALKDEGEYLRFPSNEVLVIERGTKGMVIVNVGDNGQTISSETNVASGTYGNQASYSTSLTVLDGSFTAYIPSKTILVFGDYSNTADTAKSWYVSGDINNWSASEMTHVNGYEYVYTDSFDQGDGFKIRPSSTSWNEAYPENNWVIWEGSADYTITFYSDTKEITVTKIETDTKSTQQRNGSPTASASIAISPNPVTGEQFNIMLDLEHSQPIIIRIYSTIGELVKTYHYEYTPQEPIRLCPSLAKGNYFLKVETPTTHVGSHFVKIYE